jgi:hypothetical protein
MFLIASTASFQASMTTTEASVAAERWPSVWKLLKARTAMDQ